MLAAFLITLREGLEAAVIVGIVLSVLRRLGKSRETSLVWWGVFSAAIASIAGAIGLNALGIAFEGRGEEIFEGIAMLTAAGALTWMIFWMQRQSRNIGKSLESEVQHAMTSGTSTWALFGYNDNPTLLEVIVYGLYPVVIGRISLRSCIIVTPAQKPATTSNQIQ